MIGRPLILSLFLRKIVEMSGRRVNGPEGFIDPEDLRKHQPGNYSGAILSITELRQTGRFGDYSLEARGQGPSQPSVSDASRQPTGLWSGKNVSVPLKKDCKKMGEKVNGSVGRQRAETSSFIKDGTEAEPENNLRGEEKENPESFDKFIINVSPKDLTSLAKGCDATGQMTSQSSAGEQELGNVDIGLSLLGSPQVTSHQKLSDNGLVMGHDSFLSDIIQTKSLHEAPHQSEETVNAQRILPQGVRRPAGYIKEPVEKWRKVAMPDKYQHLRSSMMLRELPDYPKDPVGNIVRKSVLPDFESLLSQPVDCCLWPEGQGATQKQMNPSQSKDQMEPSLCGSSGHLNSAIGELGVRKQPGPYSVDTVGKMAKNMMMCDVSRESQLSQTVDGYPCQERQSATQQESLNQMDPGPFETMVSQTVGSSPWQEGQCATQQQILNQMERGLFGSCGNSNSAFGEPVGGVQQVSPEEEDIPTVPLNLDNMGIDPDLPLNTGNMDFDQDLYPDLWDLDV